jgi:branched-chain amino acid transport system permease protein
MKREAVKQEAVKREAAVAGVARRPALLTSPAAILVALLGAFLLVAPFVASTRLTFQLEYGMVFAIAALGFNLLLGYTGLLSFGHSAYFGVGAYTVAMMWKYWGTGSMELYLIGSVLTSVIVSALFGYICVRRTRIFFSILALALSQVLWSLAFKFFWVTGGTDGLRVPTPYVLGGILGKPEDKIAFLSYRYYYYVLAFFALAILLMWVIVHSPFGKALQAIRDNETRAEFVGIRVQRYKWLAFLISGIFTAFAGALWAPLNGLVTPDILYWAFSGEIVFLAVLGGFRTFAGPIVGAFVFNFLKDYAVGYTVYWQFMLGAVLIVLVLVMPAGIVGTFERFWQRKPAEGEVAR